MSFIAQTVPEQFFSRTDVNERFGLGTAGALWDWVRAGATSPVAGGATALPSGSEVVYRGQARSSYGLTSSLYRLCREARPNGVSERTIAGVEAQLINDMRAEGIGRRMSDGQLLSVLQHHGVPTRLLDFSRTPLEALYFAVENHDTIDGRLFVVHAHGHRGSMTVNLDFAADGSRALPWENLARGDEYASSAWTQTVALVDPDDLDPRMVAQAGVFLVGGLNRRYGGRDMFARESRHAPTSKVPSELYADVTTLGINFLTRAGTRNQCWPATGWTVLVKAEWKPRLRELLNAEADSIRRDTMYPPLDEVWRLANYAVVARLGRGD
ncbi:FRG domain-containing protein [Cellulomonas fengjieae]|uniref:FRG domain-containing protein n=1 Tax=Cellulomonas fengjieae TaxID=2819978 RepID=A0ABS3SB85_9CELL|nr:FRG domain-containing protein [Cellulomonas fengjieae]MBO3083022.1 FRG domain-containing protein [Cellulomonas fengjieae]QVI65607.1 FRG domain-containing protein [Cellulomonas fengjieae]